FKLICKQFFPVGEDIVVVKSVFQPYLNRLKTIDKHIPTTFNINNGKEYLEAFKHEYERLSEIQWQEIQHVKNNTNNILQKLINAGYNQEHVDCLLKKFDSVNDKATSLQSLEERDILLTEINAMLINTQIFLNKDSLDISSLHLTRFPVALFSDESLQFFWK